MASGLSNCIEESQCAAAAAVTLLLCVIVPIGNRCAVCSDRIANQSIIYTHDATTTKNYIDTRKATLMKRPTRVLSINAGPAWLLSTHTAQRARASLQPEKSLLHASVPGAGEVSISQRTTRNNNLNHFLSFRVNINTVPWLPRICRQGAARVSQPTVYMPHQRQRQQQQRQRQPEPGVVPSWVLLVDDDVIRRQCASRHRRPSCVRLTFKTWP